MIALLILLPQIRSPKACFVHLDSPMHTYLQSSYITPIMSIYIYIQFSAAHDGRRGVYVLLGSSHIIISQSRVWSRFSHALSNHALLISYPTICSISIYLFSIHILCVRASHLSLDSLLCWLFAYTSLTGPCPAECPVSSAIYDNTAWLIVSVQDPSCSSHAQTFLHSDRVVSVHIHIHTYIRWVSKDMFQRSLQDPFLRSSLLLSYIYI